MYFPVGKWFHIEIRFLRTILSLGAGVNGDQPSSLAWTPKCHSQYCFPIKVSSKVQITSLCTNSWGSSEKCSFHKMGSHKHSLFGLNSVGPTFKIQDISHKNLDFWLLLKRLRSGNTGPIFPAWQLGRVTCALELARVLTPPYFSYTQSIFCSLSASCRLLCWHKTQSMP